MNKHLIILVLCLLLGSYSNAQMVTAGTGQTLTLQQLSLAPDTVIEASTDGYVIHGYLTISASDTLIIQPGERLTALLPFEDNMVRRHLLVKGSIQAIGTAEAPIIFDVTKTETVYWSWMGIYNCDQTTLSQFQHCRFIGGNTAIICRNSSPEIRNCTFENQIQNGINVFNLSSPTIVENSFSGLDTCVGIALIHPAPSCVVSNNRFQNMSTGIQIASAENINLNRCQISDMRQSGVYLSTTTNTNLSGFVIQRCAEGILAAGTSSIQITDSHIRNCQYNGMLLMNDSQVNVRDSSITGNANDPTPWQDVPFSGIQCLLGASANLGDATQPGHNLIFNNDGGNLINLTDNAISAIGNQWDSPLSEYIADRIWDEAAATANESSYIPGPVFFEPIWMPPSDLMRLGTVWQATDESWNLIGDTTIRIEDILKLLEDIRQQD